MDEDIGEYPLEEETAAAIEEIVENTMSKIYDKLVLEEDLDIEIFRIQDELKDDKMHGVGGFAESYSLETEGSTHKIGIGVNSNIEGWQDCLRATTAHEYAHIWYSENRDPLVRGTYFEENLNWENVLEEGHAMLFAEHMIDFQMPWRQPENFDISDLAPEKVVEELQTSTDQGSLFFWGRDDWPGWAGYALGYAVGKKLIEEYDDRLEGIKALVEKSEIEVAETAGKLAMQGA